MSKLTSKEVINLQEAYLQIYSTEISEEENPFKNSATLDAASSAVKKATEKSPTSSKTSSSASATDAEKIKGGMEVYNKQRAAGDFKGASETGKQVWAKANPKLAAAAAERERTRGTSATTNPLMKDFKSRLPSPQSSASSSASNVAAAGKSAVSSSPSSSTPAAKSTPRVVQTSTPASVANPFKSPGSLSAASSAVKSATSPSTSTPAKRPMGSSKPGSIVSHYDPFDVIIAHLLDEGYADTKEAALAIMVNMSEEWRESIIESQT